MKNKILRNLIIIIILFVPIRTEIIIPASNIVSAGASHHFKTKKSSRPVKKIKIGQVYWNYGYGYGIKFVDQTHYAIVRVDSSPQRIFADNDNAVIDFYYGIYSRKANHYLLSKRVSSVISISFMDMKRWREKQYTFIDESYNQKSNRSELYLKNGRYYIASVSKKNKLEDAYALSKYTNKIKGVKNTTFPNNSQEFLQQFHYLSLDNWKNKVNHFSKQKK
ncbi:hypothetical protein [Bombilactobacillus thymidiniphilus]|uniref:Surface layer protein A domain-containing protein n=1 Tax=Bombilactobacillus thymidiniphilus TaxID=2923363 RepID=A0ABY4PBU4_9LACO|nr:hypothetical protein [Bombilactobacillus thymidiniphilus]UQS83011.1 hypothetical protein MOO47_04305 [Bombilactobacillus thymidiniphilus]